MGFVGLFPVDSFAKIHFMTFKHLEEFAWLTPSRADMDNHCVEKTGLAVKVCHLPQWFILVH